MSKKEYIFRLMHTQNVSWVHDVSVEAENQEEAIEIATDMAEDHAEPFDFSFSNVDDGGKIRLDDITLLDEREPLSNEAKLFKALSRIYGTHDLENADEIHDLLSEVSDDFRNHLAEHTWVQTPWHRPEHWEEECKHEDFSTNLDGDTCLSCGATNVEVDEE